MPAKSEDALARKKQRRKERRQIMRAVELVPMDRKKPGWRRMLPPLPHMSKSELRRMLTEAVMNTANG